MQIDSSQDPFPQVRAALMEAARDRRLLTYPDVASIMGLPRSGYYMGSKVGAMADAINRVERDAGRPMLSALLVQTQSRRPGEGFYACAIQLGVVTRFADEASKRAFWEAERDKVYAYWTSSSAESSTRKSFEGRARDPEQERRWRLAKREDLETVYGIALAVPIHGQDESGTWRYGIHPSDGLSNPSIVTEFEAQIRSIFIDNAQPLIDAGMFSDREVTEIKSHEYSTGPDAEGLAPQCFF